MAAPRPGWRIGVLDSNPHSRAEVSRVIRSGGATVVLDARPGSESAALLRRLAPDAVVLAAEDALREGDPRGGILSPDLPTPVVLVSGRATALGWARIAGVMGVLLRPLRPEELRPDPRDRDRALPGAAASAAGACGSTGGGGGQD